MWLLTSEGSLYVVLLREREVIEVDLSPMRLDAKLPLFMPKPVWLASHAELRLRRWALDRTSVDLRLSAALASRLRSVARG